MKLMSLFSSGLAASLIWTSAAGAADVPLGALDWSAVGAAGLIGETGTIPVSPAGSPFAGFVSTAGGAGHFGAADNVSPLVLKTDGKGNEGPNNGSLVVSDVFSGVAGEKLSLYFNYISTDGRGYDDYAWARLVDASAGTTLAWLFTARSTNSARGNVIPGDVLDRQVDRDAPRELDAVLNNGASIGFDVASTDWAPLGVSSGYCWDSANTCGPSGWVESRYTLAGSGAMYLEFGVVNWGDEVFDSALAFDFAGLAPAQFPGLAIVGQVPEPATSSTMLFGLLVLASVARRRSRAHRSSFH